MLLRRATTEDFEICKRLYEDYKNDVLYYDQGKDQLSGEKEAKDSRQKIQLDFSKDEFYLEEQEFTMEKFELYLDDTYGRIYVFEDDDGDVIGYVKLLRITRFRWKLAEMQVNEDCQTEEVLNQIINDLSKERGIQTIEVCTPLKSVQRRFLCLGYEVLLPLYLSKSS